MIGADPSFTVSEFVAIFNQSLDMMYPSVGISGELANFKVSKGRWVYFDLKDEESSVRFFGNVQQLPGPLEDGLNLQVFGRPRLHPQFGFSVNVLKIQVVGKGSLAKAQAMLQKKLEREGLFSRERKRPLSYPPERVGLITSIESAAYTDFVKVVDQRWGNLRIELADCLVQGMEAPAQLVNAVENFNQMADPPDVLIMIRGGGSADDMSAFSTEQVVRAIAASRIPTMVAIGHERDISLAELAADKQASTPSNAAELLVPDADHERLQAAAMKKHIYNSLTSLYTDKKRLLDDTADRLADIMNNLIAHNRQDLQQKRLLVRALDPQAPLRRGFALVRAADGKLVSTVKAAEKAGRLSIDLSDGTVRAKVLEDGKKD
ncbi:MAG TPA: exodeoxyribonuclease VII large subunit [Candidatus Saccharimonadales bacterium]|nr:exodeoxyribonuclease VII large subunit [Candidatus Saccharimonadales bacterium]